MGVSIGGHALVIAIALLIGKLSLNIFNDKVEIINASVRVDVVGMPKYTLQELKELQKEMANSPVQPAEPAKTVKETVEAKKTDTPDVIKEGDLVIKEKSKDTAKAKSSLSNLLANYSDKKVAPKDAKKGTKDGTGKDLAALIIEGNRLSKGSSITGDYSDTENSAYVTYVQTIPAQVKPHWKLPPFLMGKNLRCRVRLYIGQTGQIIKTEIYESSGEPEFDSRAEQALRNAAPFASPTSEVAAQLSRSGVILGFPL